MNEVEELDTENKPLHRTTLSFVRRGARMTQSQEVAWAKYAPQYLVEVERDKRDTSVAKTEKRTPEQLFGRTAPLVVEIGIGKGEAVVHAANTTPDHDFLGIEVFLPGLGKTMMEAGKLGLSNLRVIEANAPEVLQSLLPAGSVQEVRIFFPDPWHKSKHNKRRLISSEFTSLLDHSLAPGGRVRMATDWQHYADQMREVFDASPVFEREFEGDWAPRFEGRPLTAFEQKGQRAGRVIRDLCYIKP